MKCVERAQAGGERFRRSIKNLPADFHKLKTLKCLVQYFRAFGHVFVIQPPAHAQALYGSQAFHPEQVRRNKVICSGELLERSRFTKHLSQKN
jgi:hypothetical protein